MAITINKQPAEYHSGYNPVEYEIESNFRAELGFRYIVELYQGLTKFAEFSVAPDIKDGNKGNIDISRILQNKLDGFFANTTYNSFDARGTYFQYDIRFGESRINQWDFNDYVWVAGDGLALTTDSAYDPSFSDATHNYQIGDQILVKTNATYPDTDNRQFLNTYFEVVDVPDNKTVVLNANYNLIGSFPATPGTTTFADNRKDVTRNMVNSTKYVINTAMNRKEYITTSGSLDSYNMATGTDNLILTNQPEKYSVTPEQHVYFNILKGQNKSLIFENSNGDVFSKVITGSATVTSLGVGPGNLGTITVLSGTASLIKDDTKWYKVKVANNDNTTDSSIEYKFNLDKRCQINPIQIQFMDRKGSFNSFAFQLKKRENVQTTKESYNKFVSDNTTYAAGNTVYHSEVEKTMTLTTNFMGEAMNLYFEELMTSRRTYILLDKDWYSCTVQDTSFENEFERNNKMINKQITVKFDLNNPIN